MLKIIRNLRKFYRSLYKTEIFKESVLAHKYLDNLVGVEIGGSAHNPFGLNTINVDRSGDMSTVYKEEEQKMCGKKLGVDVISEGDNLPFDDKSYDFVISSHVIEHFFDPIKALKEWQRVAKKYIFIIVPHRDRTFDKDRPLTSKQELIDRYEGKIPYSDSNEHHSVWDTDSFLELCKYLNYNVVDYLDVDDKVGNGFCIVIKL